MSEQQKDSGADGAAHTVPAAQASDNPAQVGIENAGADVTKPKRRSSSKVRAAADVSEAPAKPKKARSSTRSAKPRNVLDARTPPSAEGAPAEVAAQVDPDGLPPLPPAPVPTPEGIAFMQQHAVYQSALEEGCGCGTNG